MIPHISFDGFEPDDDTRTKVYHAVEKLQDAAPYGAMVVAQLKFDHAHYQCAIEIYSKHGPFISRASDVSVDVVLAKVVQVLSRKLERWKQLRPLYEGGDLQQQITSVA